jgi:uncharacterized protein (TIGR02594 family)
VTTPPWLLTAFGEVGTHETIGPAATPRIVEYAATTSLAAVSDEVPWCSSFVNWCVREAGLLGTDSASARSWLGWGKPTAARLGAIAVFSRGAPPTGHVAFFLYAVGPFVIVLGGNQGNAVSVTAMSEDRLLGLRWPG